MYWICNTPASTCKDCWRIADLIYHIEDVDELNQKNCSTLIHLKSTYITLHCEQSLYWPSVMAPVCFSHSYWVERWVVPWSSTWNILVKI